jgi:hypothetical protein
MIAPELDSAYLQNLYSFVNQAIIIGRSCVVMRIVIDQFDWTRNLVRIILASDAFFLEMKKKTVSLQEDFGFYVYVKGRKILVDQSIFHIRISFV